MGPFSGCTHNCARFPESVDGEGNERVGENEPKGLLSAPGFTHPDPEELSLGRGPCVNTLLAPSRPAHVAGRPRAASCFGPGQHPLSEPLSRVAAILFSPFVP